MKSEKEPDIIELKRLEEELSNSKDLVNLNDNVSVYLKDISLVKLLTREEEIELAQLVSNARNSKDKNITRLGKRS